MDTAARQDPIVIEKAQSWLHRHTGLADEQRFSVSVTADQLIKRLTDEQESPHCIALSGAPGSGKSTLARLVSDLLTDRGLISTYVSLDDYYLPASMRETFSAHKSKGTVQRGLPGTHDLGRLERDLSALLAGQISGLKLVSFDKSMDDRSGETEWRSIEQAPKVVVLEGWCLGPAPGPAAWRGLPEVLVHWQRLTNVLTRYVSELWYIRNPDWNSVVGWRWQQEKELRHRMLTNREAVEKFLEPFQTIAGSMRDRCKLWADVVIDADVDHLLKITKTRENNASP